jgi:hydrophobic/amphiphilic exporter-1 (mainly G- bacteria), HAE1 family
VLDQVSDIAGKNAAVENVIAISGVSALDNNSTLANSGVAYVVLKDWSVRGKGQDLRSLFQQFNRDFAAISEARIVVFPPPPIQGIGNAGGFAMQIELRDGSFDLAKLQTTTTNIVRNAQTQSELQRVTSSFRSTVPQLKVDVDRAKAETLQVSIDDVFSALAAYLGSSYVDQFNKFGRVWFEARLHALARTHHQLIKSNWTGLSLSEVMQCELEPFAARTRIEGANVTLAPQQAQNFSLAVHELATNAAKHGALS